MALSQVFKVWWVFFIPQCFELPLLLTPRCPGRALRWEMPTTRRSAEARHWDLLHLHRDPILLFLSDCQTTEAVGTALVATATRPNPE